jgi:hypothetical protein
MNDPDRRFLEALVRSARSDGPSLGAKHRALAGLHSRLADERRAAPIWAGGFALAFVALLGTGALGPSSPPARGDDAPRITTTRTAADSPCAAGVEAPAGACTDVLERSAEGRLVQAAGSSSGAALGTSS